MKRLAIVLVLCFSPTVARAQPPRDEVHTQTPDYRGTRANAPIPAHLHKRNEGGSDGSGLCVICSLVIAGQYQGVPNLDELWRVAKSRPGGYSPNKLQSLLDEVMPEEKWASYVGTNPKILEELSAAGYPIGATMNTGELYHYQQIHHMIDLIHFDYGRDLACVVDNNQPGVYTWMTAKEYLRRWKDGGTGWAFVWLRKVPSGTEEAAIMLIVASVIAFVLISRHRRPRAVTSNHVASYQHGNEPDE